MRMKPEGPSHCPDDHPCTPAAAAWLLVAPARDLLTQSLEELRQPSNHCLGLQDPVLHNCPHVVLIPASLRRCAILPAPVTHIPRMGGALPRI